ncbi:hypothetical protein IGI04_022325 [Brassica rapa subsp. trilocularis]|uniref:Uncharacterized protein n=1 Tax=Brassica rapa subsp. trilocularis TaxID=1813537 RepID=A0ABQ7M0M5_BRACM|nr:hypothetical protein IGI04_022325 [Brassica rapa subsp. trilocularis]
MTGNSSRRHDWLEFKLQDTATVSQTTKLFRFLLLLSVISDCITNLHPYTAYRVCITKPSLVLVQVIQSSLKLPRLANIFNQHARDEAGEDMATNQPAIRKVIGGT